MVSIASGHLRSRVGSRWFAGAGREKITCGRSRAGRHHTPYTQCRHTIIAMLAAKLSCYVEPNNTQEMLSCYVIPELS